MDWEHIIGQGNLKAMLKASIHSHRVGHAQLFTGKDGCGTLALALAFAKEIFTTENPKAAGKTEHLNHVDLHFSFPVYKVKDGLSSNFSQEFREMVLENPYADFQDWLTVLDSENKQLAIYKDEVESIIEKFQLKSFEGGSRILIMWHAEKMNTEAANKFLKFLEEPPKDTLIILTAENTDGILPTILSRTQIVEVPRISDEDMAAELRKAGNISDAEVNAAVFRAQGDWNVAQKTMHKQASSAEFEEYFIRWVREAFQVKKKPQFLKNIVLWGRTIATWNREKQKSFLAYCAEMFRLAMLQNYAAETLVYRKIDAGGFKWEGFSKFIHGANIEAILEEISAADYHLERNANARIVWTDLGIKLSRYIHKKNP